MATELMDDLSRRRNGEVGLQSDLQEKLEPALLEMLAGVRRHRETPLMAGVDSHGIVHAALQNLSVSASQVELDYLQDSETVEAILNLLIKQSLLDEPDHSEARICSPRREQSRQQRNEQGPHPMAVWLEHFHAVMGEVHPEAVEIVILRVEGCDNREVAQRLGLPLRLVKRVVHDMQRAWKSAPGKE